MRSPLFACRRLKCTSCSLIAAYMRTGALTRPNEIAPLQSARGMHGDGPRGSPSNPRSGRVELDAHVLVGTPLLHAGALAQGVLVAHGERLLGDEREAARPERARTDDVELGREQRYVGPDVEPGEEADHDREDAVGA